MLVQRALDSVHGVDVNPFAIAIARFRLLLAALKECGISRLKRCSGLRDSPRLRRFAACTAALAAISGRLGVSDDRPRLSARGSGAAWIDCFGRRQVSRGRRQSAVYHAQGSALERRRIAIDIRLAT